jgi:enamine deaminase RidA (YjgF/YER057c/UK114 family)
MASTAEERLQALGLTLPPVSSRVQRVVKVFGMVNAVPDFTSHTEVINGCSDLLVAVLGERGEHARSAIGVGSLPKGFAVEIEAVVEFA